MKIKRWVVGGIFIYLVLGVCTWFFLFRPQMAELKRVSFQKEEFEDFCVGLEVSPQTIKQFQARRDKISEAIALFQRTMPSKDQTQLILVRLGKISEASGVEVRSITPLPSKKLSDNLVMFSWSVGLSGGYHNLGTFINKFEDSSSCGIDKMKIISGMFEHAVSLTLHTVGAIK